MAEFQFKVGDEVYNPGSNETGVVTAVNGEWLTTDTYATFWAKNTYLRANPPDDHKNEWWVLLDVTPPLDEAKLVSLIALREQSHRVKESWAICQYQNTLLRADADLLAAARDGLRWRQFIVEVGADLEDMTIADLDYLRRIREDATAPGDAHRGEGQDGNTNLR